MLDLCASCPLQVIRVGSGIDYRHVAQHAQQEGADAPAAGAGEGARGLRLVGRGEETGPRLRQEWERWLAQHGLQVGLPCWVAILSTQASRHMASGMRRLLGLLALVRSHLMQPSGSASALCA